MKKLLSVYAVMLLLLSTPSVSVAQESTVPDAADSSAKDTSPQVQIPVTQTPGLAQASTKNIEAPKQFADIANQENIPQQQLAESKNQENIPQQIADAKNQERLSPQQQVDNKTAENGNAGDTVPDKVETISNQQLQKKTDANTPTLSDHAVPAPYVDEKLHAEDKTAETKNESSKQSAFSVMKPQQLYPIIAPFAVLTKNEGQYYAYAGFSPLLTINLLAVGISLILFSVVFLRPRILVRRFVNIRYLESPVEDHTFLPFIGNIKKRFLPGVAHNNDNKSIFYKLSF